jgi:hypothetical protein
MILQEFRDILLTADPNASHYTSEQQPNYTVWAEYGDRAISADGARQEEDKTWKIQVDRYTKIEYDPMADTIRDALNNAGIPFDYLCDVEKDENGKLIFIHHIFDCEAI